MDEPPCSAAFSFPPVVPPAMDEEQVDEEQVDEEQVDEEHFPIASEELSPVEIEERGPGLGDLQVGALPVDDRFASDSPVSELDSERSPVDSHTPAA
uniref:Uncharacterized protein n=1 Tax=Knipowitschia caucasica TaxID=637954 RepID=A0AAV2JNH0_KNICA